MKSILEALIIAEQKRRPELTRDQIIENLKTFKLVAPEHLQEEERKRLRRERNMEALRAKYAKLYKLNTH